MNAYMHNVGLVAIGRNEGERLKRCLTAANGQVEQVVYVDSGSTDGSVAFARSLGVEVVDLDLSVPFTAARARNAGYKRLMEVMPGCEFVQFVDGDCELVEGYIAKALQAFAHNGQLGIVSGRRREREPGASVYNKLCDMEWDTPVGLVRSCHGDAMVRCEAFDQAGWFDETLIAGEEPEMCVRLRARGWQIERIDCEMTLHDAAMSRLSQWWKRMVRAGHAYAEGAAMHGAPPERHNVKAVRSAVVWGSILQWGLPLLIGLSLIPVLWPWSLIGLACLLLLIGLMVVKVARYRVSSRGDRWSDALIYGAFTMMGKVPTLQGIRKYRRNKRSGMASRLIEYKGEGAV